MNCPIGVRFKSPILAADMRSISLRSSAMVEKYWHEIQKLNPTIEEPEAAMLILNRTADTWDHFFPTVQRAVLASLLHRITVTETGLDMAWKFDSLTAVSKGAAPGVLAHELAALEAA